MGRDLTFEAYLAALIDSRVVLLYLLDRLNITKYSQAELRQLVRESAIRLTHHRLNRGTAALDREKKSFRSVGAHA